jgi:tRNA(Arg) A34 adenosine deaminase TadA
LKKNFQNISKNKTSGASVVQNVKIRRKHPCVSYEMYIGLIPCNICTYLLQTSSITALIYLLWFVLASITKKGKIEREIGSHLFLNDFGG